MYADSTNTILTVKDAPTMASLRSSAKTSSASSKPSAAGTWKKNSKKVKKEATRVMDDIDLDLYGPEPDEEEEQQSDEEDVEMEASAGANDIPIGDSDISDAQSKSKAAMANPEGHSTQSTHWCLIYRADGALEVMRCCFI